MFHPYILRCADWLCMHDSCFLTAIFWPNCRKTQNKRSTESSINLCRNNYWIFIHCWIFSEVFKSKQSFFFIRCISPKKDTTYGERLSVELAQSVGICSLQHTDQKSRLLQSHRTHIFRVTESINTALVRPLMNGDFHVWFNGITNMSEQYIFTIPFTYQYPK